MQHGDRHKAGDDGVHAAQGHASFDGGVHRQQQGPQQQQRPDYLIPVQVAFDHEVGVQRQQHLDTGGNEVARRAQQEAMMHQHRGCTQQQWRDRQTRGPGRVVQHRNQHDHVGGGKQDPAPRPPQRCPLLVGGASQHLDARPQRRALVGGDGPEVCHRHRAPRRRHDVRELAQLREPGEPEEAANHHRQAAVEGQPVGPAQGVQAQQHQAEHHHRRRVDVVVAGVCGAVRKHHQVEQAPGGVERQDREPDYRRRQPLAACGVQTLAESELRPYGEVVDRQAEGEQRHVRLAQSRDQEC